MKRKAVQKLYRASIVVLLGATVLSVSTKVLKENAVSKTESENSEVTAGVSTEIQTIIRETELILEAEHAETTEEPEITKEPILEQETRPAYIWSEEEEYLLCKIAMAEMEGESTEAKALVMCVVMNRVKSGSFQGTIKEVIYEKNQFTPIWNGRFDRVEPNDDCRTALEMVRAGWDESEGATFFEITSENSTWHSRNLKRLFEIDGTTFYKEKE